MLLKPASFRITHSHVSATQLLIRRHPGCTAAREYRSRIVVRAAAGGGVADKPVTTPDKSKEKRTSRRRPPIYRVLLHNDNFNSREYVVRVLVKVIDCLSLDDAVNVMQVAHVSGIALVTACAQEEAETYCQGLRNNGLTSTIEPDGGSGPGAEI